MFVYFLTRDRKGCGFSWRVGQEDLRGLGVGATVIRIYCIKIFVFNKRNLEEKKTKMNPSGKINVIL